MGPCGPCGPVSPFGPWEPVSPFGPREPVAPFKFLKAKAKVGAAVVPPLVTVTDGVPTFASMLAEAVIVGVAPVAPVSPFTP